MDKKTIRLTGPMSSHPDQFVRSYQRVWMGGGGSGIHYSLKISPLFISLKFWAIH